MRPTPSPTYTARLKDHGVFLAEDPCYFAPDASFERLRKACALPLLVDHDCRSLPEASLFLDRGAEALSVKVGKSGFSESREIAPPAHERGAKTHVGMLGESSLGALAALQLASALPDRGRLAALRDELSTCRCRRSSCTRRSRSATAWSSCRTIRRSEVLWIGIACGRYIPSRDPVDVGCAGRRGIPTPATAASVSAISTL